MGCASICPAVVFWVAAATCLLTACPAMAQPDADDWTSLSLDDGRNWSFVGGDWRQNEQGVITPPGVRTDDNLAFRTDTSYTDFEAEFEFQWQFNHCGAGFVVRAQDPGHYYLVQFPCCGQHYRAKHFWAAISKADGSGWLRILRMEMVPGVPSELHLWHKVRIVVEGDEIRMWIDDHPFPVVRDDDYKSGFVGLESWTYVGVPRGGAFRNIRIRGEADPDHTWSDTPQPAKNWFHPFPVTGRQSVEGITEAPNGDLLMAVSPGGLVRSTDRGRSWVSADAQNFPGGSLGVTRDKRIIAVDAPDRKKLLLTSYSDDNGHSWSEPEERLAIPLPDQVAIPSINALQVLDDGTMLFYVHGRSDATHSPQVTDWGTLHSEAFVLRSTDDGKTWQGPITLDGPPATGNNMDLSEQYTAQLEDGRILALIRPVYSPWLWETWSKDRGATWAPSARGPFPGYACTMLHNATASGALVIAGRMPGLAAHVSHDNGITWRHYRVATDTWAMGVMHEVEPDLVLYVYMAGDDGPLRAQFLRVTPTGLAPAPPPKAAPDQ